MARQWAVLGTTVAVLGLGAFALARFAPDSGTVEVGSVAPDFRVTDLATGTVVSLRDRYRGRVTLVNIWATYCVPCRVEMPAMQGLYDSLGTHGLRIAAISIDPGPGTQVLAFARQYHLGFDILQDQDTRIRDAYQTTGVPESFLLNQDGIIVKRVIGAHDWNSEVNRSLVRRLLPEAGQ